MNIKSLILGSATVALAATGAQAADAIIIAEPEPVEYVRVCDVYGAGYFYIPGTETCLRISGWVRHQMDSRVSANVSVDRNITTPSTQRGPLASNGLLGRATSSIKSSTRANLRERGIHQGTGAQINFDARSETEYGTLRGWVQLEGFNRNRDHSQDIGILINRAVIQLGGLYMGYADSLFSSSSNIGGSGLGNYAGFSFADTFDYHYEQRHQIGYQFSGGNGFWGAIGLEHNDTDARFTARSESWAPNVVAKVAYQQAWGGAWLAAAYDEQARGYGVKGGIQGNFGALTARLDASYRSKAGSTYGPRVNLTGPWRDGTVGEDARWGVQATALYQFNPKWGVAAGVGYYDNLVATGSSLYDNATSLLGVPYVANTIVGGGIGTSVNGVANNASRQFVGGHAWTAQLGLNWTPVQNFQVGADVIYRKAEVKLTDNLGNTAKLKGDATSFRLRFQRNF